MKKEILAALLIVSLIASCSRRPYSVTASNDHVFSGNPVLISVEDLSSPKFAALKNKYQLDTVFHGEKDELKRILLLRHWIRKVISIDNIGPYPGDGSVESILDEALKGHGFHCGHYMIVQNAIMNGYGYVARCIKADEGAPDALEGHHGLDEIWLNSYGKWFLSDAKYDYHFEKNNIPLSALEIRDEYLKNKAADIVLVKGPDRTPTAFYPELNNRSKEQFARIYTWISWEKYNDPYSGTAHDSSNMIMYKDAYSSSHTWLRGGKPHWAYNTRYLEFIDNRSWIEWTPNTITSTARINADSLLVSLTSITPGFKTYQMKILPDNNWADISSSITIPLNHPEEIAFRSVNIFDVAGPEHKMIIEQ